MKRGFIMKQINNGFKSRYYLTENGKVYNNKSGRYLKADRNSYTLAQENGKYKRITIRDLYKLVYNTEYEIDDTENLEGEQWKAIDNTDNKYYVSNKGRVKSKRGLKAYILHPYKSGNYERVDIIYSGNIRKCMLVHRLVAAAFLEQPKNTNCYYIHHKDFNSCNNCASNLIWLDIVEHTKIHIEQRQLQKEKGELKEFVSTESKNN